MAALKLGIVGLPNASINTLFNILSKDSRALLANDPFAFDTLDANMGILAVRDKRLDKLSEMLQTSNVLPTTIEIVNISSLLHKEEFNNQSQVNIRELDAIVYVLNSLDGEMDLMQAKEIIDLYFGEHDLKNIDKHLIATEKMVDMKLKESTILLLENMKRHVTMGKRIREILPSLSLGDQKIPLYMTLITTKPVLYICNVAENELNTGNTNTKALEKSIANENTEIVLVCMDIEEQIADMDSPEERAEFLDTKRLSELGTHRLAHSCYKLFNLITYFTVGKKGVQTWTVPNGAKAPEAAGVINSDFEKGFIRAEVIKYNDFIAAGSKSKAIEMGKMFLKDKSYVVADGDIIEFLHS